MAAVERSGMVIRFCWGKSWRKRQVGCSEQWGKISRQGCLGETLTKRWRDRCKKLGRKWPRENCNTGVKEQT